VHRTAVALVALLLLAGAAGVSTSAQPAADRCGAVDESVRARFTPGARVAIMLAAGNTVPAGMRDTYREIALAVVSCLGEGSHVDVLPITDNGYDAAPAFSGTLEPPPPGNSDPLWPRTQLARLESAASAAVDRILGSTHPYDGSDPLGTLHAAGESLHRSATPTRLIAVMIDNGWQQTKRLDLHHYHQNPGRRAGDVIRALKADGTLPNLRRTDVLVVGVTSGSRGMSMGGPELQGLCDFWGAVIRASGGTKVLADCPMTLPGLTLPVQ
jgi:hypothetical protein